MKAVWLEVPQHILEERSRTGLDKLDEVWDGVLHMVPPPKIHHARVEGRLFEVLRAISRRRDLEALTNVGVFDPAIPEYKNFRVPDISIVASSHESSRGIEGEAVLVVEVLSPDDESRDKLPFYARVGVREVWLVDRKNRRVEIFAGTQRIERSQLGLELQFEGAVLHLRDGADTYTVDTADTP